MFFRDKRSEKSEQEDNPGTARRDIRDRFNGDVLTSALLIEDPTSEYRILWNLMGLAEHTRLDVRDSKELLAAILSTQREILAELRTLNGKSR